jgi:Xaa-Pro dipeptidase
MNNIVGRGFSIEEFENRFLKIKSAMLKNNLDAILVTTEADFHYFSGLQSQFWVSPTRPMYLILPSNGFSPIAIIPELMLNAINNTWIKNIHSWPAPYLKDDGVSLLLKLLKLYTNIGMSMNIESTLRMPLKHLLYISKELKTNFIDVSKLISDIRLIKSSAEIEKIECACQITSICFEELPERLENLQLEHITERIAVREMQLSLIEKGIDNVKYIVGKSGVNGYNSVVDGPTDKILVPGDIFVIDTGAIFDGYFCDFDRNFTINNKDNTIDHLFTEKYNLFLWEATNEALKIAKPNNTFGDIWNGIVEYLSSKGIDKNDYNKGRMGHSIGLQLTELPSIIKEEETILKEGMTISIEPFIKTIDNKILVHEECIVITKDGNRLLSKRCPSKCYNINVCIDYNPYAINIYNPLQKRKQLSEQTLFMLKEYKEKEILCEKFHNTIDKEMTPLINMSKLESELNIKEILVKDEGMRFGLKSFKGLGVLFAIHLLDKKPRTICTMTDGNHGKGVAFAAKKLGIKAIIFVPNNMSNARQQALKDLDADVIVVNGSYDLAVEEVKKKALDNNWLLVSDTSWEGYTEIPTNIMIGYSTIFREIEKQRINKQSITHVIIQAGVGGLASASAAWIELNKYKSDVWSNDIQLIIVEPVDADCIVHNVIKQKNNTNSNTQLVSCIGTTNSIMSGLNCGTPSYIAWSIIKDIASLFVTIGDNWAKIGMKKMYNENIISGESGAAGIATILAKTSLFNKDSIILTINTESDTDPDSFKNIIINE